MPAGKPPPDVLCQRLSTGHIRPGLGRLIQVDGADRPGGIQKVHRELIIAGLSSEYGVKRLSRVRYSKTSGPSRSPSGWRVTTSHRLEDELCVWLFAVRLLLVQDLLAYSGN